MVNGINDKKALIFVLGTPLLGGVMFIVMLSFILNYFKPDEAPVAFGFFMAIPAFYVGVMVGILNLLTLNFQRDDYELRVDLFFLVGIISVSIIFGLIELWIGISIFICLLGFFFGETLIRKYYFLHENKSCIIKFRNWMKDIN